MDTRLEIKETMLSIIVPVYNVEKYIKQCIESLVSQTLKDMEIIVVNDETKDNSIEIVKEFHDNRIKIVNKKNGGLSSARNAGIEIARGKYIAFVDSDDFIDFNSAYEDMIKLANKYAADIVVGNANWYYNSNKKSPMNIDKKMFKNKVISAEKYIVESIKSKRIFVPVWLNLYKRELMVSNNIYFKNGILHEDELFSPQIFLKAKKVALYEKDFYNYRQREGSIMNSSAKDKRVKDVFSTCLELSEIIKTLPNSEVKLYLSNYIVDVALAVSYKYKERVPRVVKKMITQNSNKSTLKIKAKLLNLNENFYYLVEFIDRKLIGLYRRLRKAHR